MIKITLFTDSSFALFSALQILKAHNQQADLLTIKDFWLNNFKEYPLIRPQLIQKFPRGLKRYIPLNHEREKSKKQILDYFYKNQPDEIWLHEIYSDIWNWVAYTYKNLYPEGIIRLLPESFLNAIDMPVSSHKYKMQSFKKLMNKSYTPFQGQWIGLNARYKSEDLIKNIYLPRNFPHPYKEDKVKYFDFSLKTDEFHSHKAILVEQALLDRKMLTEKQLQNIYQKLQKDWDKHNISEICIAAHPRAKKRDFAFTQLPTLKRKHIFLEEDIATQGFSHIYSSYSMIFLSKNQLSSRFVSFGLDDISSMIQKQQYLHILKQLNIEFL